MSNKKVIQIQVSQPNHVGVATVGLLFDDGSVEVVFCTSTTAYQAYTSSFRIIDEDGNILPDKGK